MIVLVEINKELYTRLAKLAQGFESPSSVIERLLDAYESSFSASKPEVLFIPMESEFKRRLLLEKKAWKVLEYHDGTSRTAEWKVSRLSEKSNLRANLWSGVLRDWRAKGIKKLTLYIDEPKADISVRSARGTDTIDIKVGSFVKDHRKLIAQYCNANSEHINQLSNSAWCKDVFDINFPLLCSKENVDLQSIDKRFWKETYLIGGKEYRFCSQFGGGAVVGTSTLSERRGQKFIRYLDLKKLRLNKYKGVKINFIVGNGHGS